MIERGEIPSPSWRIFRRNTSKLCIDFIFALWYNMYVIKGKEKEKMNWSLFWLFVILNVVNVVIQTVKSIATIRCGKGMASIVNAVAYGLYTVVVVYTVCDLPLWLKVVIVGLANLIGVYVVKLLEEKARKDKLWKVEATVLRGHTTALHCALVDAEISHNYLENVGKYTLFNVYCETQTDSTKAKEVLDRFEAKYFVSESKTL